MARGKTRGASTAERSATDASGSGTAARKLRCAIYTRKSTEEGLDQAFNSLDAQREACAAYVMSQTHEGWTLLPDRYDDGGWSGGNLERPALTRLLADVQAGRVDVIVVYKVDRLTRALAGFAKIVDVLDAAGASFVSVTQAFNTTTSMGRLTLNVLLSFAQFEREVIAERVRDKIAASKKKGMWMGGNVPLGYDVQARKLVVNDAEAATVRHIYTRYLALNSVPALLDELREAGVVTKMQHQRSGAVRGGIPFARGSLYHLLANQLYLGEVAYQGQVYPGEHSAIVDRALWEHVQAQLASNASDRSNPTNAKCPSLLAGLVYDEQGRKLSASHAVKGSKRYRYYITHGSQLDPPGDKQTRVPAHELEQLVVQRLLAWLSDPALAQAHTAGTADAAALQAAFTRVARLVSELRGIPSQRRAAILTIVARVDVGVRDIQIAVRCGSITGVGDAALDAAASEQMHLLSVSTTNLRMGQGVRAIVSQPEQPSTQPASARLIVLLHEAQRASALVIARPNVSLTTIARDIGQCRTNLGELLKLAYLAPAIVNAIVDGTADPSLTRAALLAAVDGPLAWTDQQHHLG